MQPCPVGYFTTAWLSVVSPKSCEKGSQSITLLSSTWAFEHKTRLGQSTWIILIKRSFKIGLSFSLRCNVPSKLLYLLILKAAVFANQMKGRSWGILSLSLFHIKMDRRPIFYKFWSQICSTNNLQCSNCCHHPCSHSCWEAHSCHCWAHNYHHIHSLLCTLLSSHKGKKQKCHCMLMGRERHSLRSGSGVGRAVLCGRTEPASLNAFTKCTANTESYTLAYGMVGQNCLSIADFDHQLVFIFIFYFKRPNQQKPEQRMLSGTAYSVLLQVWVKHLARDYPDSVFQFSCKGFFGHC